VAKNEQVERGSVGVALWGEIQNALSREEECSLERRQDLIFFFKNTAESQGEVANFTWWEIRHGGKILTIGTILLLELADFVRHFKIYYDIIFCAVQYTFSFISPFFKRYTTTRQMEANSAPEIDAYIPGPFPASSNILTPT
jgi:hypothetical protein